MKTAEDIQAVLTIHAVDDGEYVLRISDLRYRPLIVQVAKLLEDAKSLIVVTPSDIKVLRVSASPASGDRSSQQVAGEGRDAGTADPSAEVEVPVDQLDPEMQAAIAEQEGRSLDPDVIPETGMKAVRRRKPNGGAAGHAEQCGRCRGTGKVQIIEADGTAGEAACKVCLSTGVIQRYGARR